MCSRTLCVNLCIARVEGSQVIRICECESFYFSSWSVSTRGGKRCRRYERNAHMQIFIQHLCEAIPWLLILLSRSLTNKGVRVWKKVKVSRGKYLWGKPFALILMEGCLSQIKPFKGWLVSKGVTLRALKCVLWSWMTQQKTGAKSCLQWLNSGLGLTPRWSRVGESLTTILQQNQETAAIQPPRCCSSGDNGISVGLGSLRVLSQRALLGPKMLQPKKAG